MEREGIDFLDLGLLAIVLALCITTGLFSVYSTNKRAYQYHENYMQDKNTAKKNNAYMLKEYGGYDATLSRSELMLMTQIQDENMPSPKSFKINSTQFTVDYAYHEYLKAYGDYMKAEIAGDAKDSRYILSYEYKVDSNGNTINEYFKINKQ